MKASLIATRSAGSIFLDKSMSPTSAANVGVTGTTVMVMDDVLPARPLIVVHYDRPAGSAQSSLSNAGCRESRAGGAHGARAERRHFRSSMLGGGLTAIGAAERWTQQPSASEQGPPSGPRIDCDAHKCRNLTGPAYHRPGDGQHIGCAIMLQSDHRSRWQIPVCRVDDRAADGKWNVVRGGDPGGDMGLHVYSHCTRLRV